MNKRSFLKLLAGLPFIRGTEFAKQFNPSFHTMDEYHGTPPGLSNESNIPTVTRQDLIDLIDSVDPVYMRHRFFKYKECKTPEDYLRNYLTTVEQVDWDTIGPVEADIVLNDEEE